MLFAALTNAVCLNKASFSLSLICANAFYFHAMSLFISFFLICIMHSAFNLFIFPNYMFTSLLLFFFFLYFFIYFLWKGYELSGEIALKNNHYYYYCLNYFKVDFVSLKTIINDINLTNRVQACDNNDDKWECFDKTIADGVIHSGLVRRKSAARNRKQWLQENWRTL